MGRVPHGRKDVGRTSAAVDPVEGRTVRVSPDLGAHALGLAPRESPDDLGRASRVGRVRGRLDALERKSGPLEPSAEPLAVLDALGRDARGIRTRDVGRSDRAKLAREHGRIPVQALDRAGRSCEQEGRPVAGPSSETLPALPGVAGATPGGSEGLGVLDRDSGPRKVYAERRRAATAGTSSRGRPDALGNGRRDSATLQLGSRRAGGGVGE
jgi:hypothetical protein